VGRGFATVELRRLLNLPIVSGDNRAAHEALDGEQPAETEAIMARSSGHIFAANSTAVAEDGSPLVKREQLLASSSTKPETAMIPTHESLMAIKHKKKLLTNGTEQFNLKPSKVPVPVSFIQLLYFAITCFMDLI
jgi:hypothetical protein